MGIRNSTITRVMPFCDYIKKSGNGIINNLNKFLTLFPKKIQIEQKSEIQEFCYGKDDEYIKVLKEKSDKLIDNKVNRTKEKPLPPCKELLFWCVNNVSSLKQKEFEKLRDKISLTDTKRFSLYQGNETVKKEALEGLKNMNINSITSNLWYVFEGCTYPDIYIETNDAIFVGEAKRTEDDITQSTKWLENRDQLVRHIDAVIDKQKKVYAFYIVEKLYDFSRYKNKEFYKQNAPHRNEDTINKMMKSYIGYTTWKKINTLFENEIKFPDTINDLY